MIASPYPWHYTLRWPIYFMWPSKRNHTNIERTLDKKIFKTASNKIIRLLFCGDIMTLNHDTIPTLHPRLCSLIQSADFFIGNCEAIVGHQNLNQQAKYGFIFHMPRDYLQNIIQQTKLSPSQWLLSIANNHAGDIDVNALTDHYSILEQMGVKVLGQHVKDQLPLYVIEKNDLRIGLVAWTEWLNRNIFSTAHPGINRNTHVMTQNWRSLKSKLKLNYIIGLPHWEYEFQHFPHAHTRTLAKKLINDLGMDFVIGAHTHTLQPIEYFTHGMCAYNLGNFAGQGRAWSVKLNTLLEIQLEPHSTHPLVSYQLHYFFQEHDNKAINIIPLDEASLKEQKRLIKLINKLYITQLK